MTYSHDLVLVPGFCPQQVGQINIFVFVLHSLGMWLWLHVCFRFLKSVKNFARHCCESRAVVPTYICRDVCYVLWRQRLEPTEYIPHERFCEGYLCQFSVFDRAALFCQPSLCDVIPICVS